MLLFFFFYCYFFFPRGVKKCSDLFAGINCDRFTSDVKIKSISVVGGADGTSPCKMRA